MKKQQLLYRFTIFCFFSILLFSCTNETPNGKQIPENIMLIDSLNHLAINSPKDSLKLDYASQALSLAKEGRYLKGIGWAHNTIGMVYKQKGNFENAYNNLDSALLFNRQLGDSIETANTLFNLGELFLNEGMLLSARQCYLNGHSILKREEDNFDSRKFFKALGYAELGCAKSADLTYSELVEIEAHLNNAFENFKKSNDSTGLIKTYLTSGKIFYDLDSLSEARSDYLAALKICQAIRDTTGIAYCQNGLGSIESDNENFKLAEDYFTAAKINYQHLRRPPEIFDTDYNLCLNWLNLGELQKAESAAEKNIRPIFKTDKNYKSKEWAASLFAEIYYEKLYNNNEKSYGDSIIKYKNLELDNFEETLDYTKTRSLANLNFSHQTELKDIKFSKTETEAKLSKTQRNLAVLVVALLSCGFIFYYSRKKAKENLLTKEIETQKLQLEDKIQKAEVGAANSVIAALEEERKKIARMIHDKLGSTLVTVNRGLKGHFEDSNNVNIEKSMLESYTQNLDEVYNNLRDISHLLDDQSNLSLIEKLEKFCDLFTGFGKLKIQFLKEGDFSNLDKELRNKLFLFAKELITNVLKYSEASKVEIQLIRFEKMISLSVIDEGKGFDLEKTPLGFGLSKMKSDVESMNGSFLLDSKPDFGTTVMIDIPK